MIYNGLVRNTAVIRMCGRVNLTSSPELVEETFTVPKMLRYETSYNIPPGQKILAIVQLDDGSFKGVNLYWGLIPHWSKDRKISTRLINARAETLTEKPSFRAAYQQRRRLIPATGFGLMWLLQCYAAFT